MLGTSSCRDPSSLRTSMARPRLTCSGCDQHRLAVHLGVGVVHLRRRGQRPDHGVADEVGEGDLAAAAAAEVVVDHDAVVDQQLGRDGAHARGGGHGQAGGHVGRGPGGGAAQPDLGRVLRGPAARGGRGRRCRPGRRALAPVRRTGAAGARPLRPAAGCAGAAAARRPAPAGAACALAVAARPPAAAVRAAAPRLGRPAAWRLRRLRLVVGEEVPPGPVDRAGIRQVPLVKLVHQPFVGPEVGARRCLRPAGTAGRGGALPPAGRRLARRAGARRAACSCEIRGNPRRLRRHGGHRPLPKLDCLSVPHTRLPACASGVQGSGGCLPGSAGPEPDHAEQPVPAVRLQPADKRALRHDP